MEKKVHKSEPANKSTTSLSPFAFACELSSPDLLLRKATVLESLRKQITDKTELANGFAFSFPGTDEMLDELLEFVKTERQCCPFFTFTLRAGSDKQPTLLELTGPEGAKAFITSELDL